MVWVIMLATLALVQIIVKWHTLRLIFSIIWSISREWKNICFSFCFSTDREHRVSKLYEVVEIAMLVTLITIETMVKWPEKRLNWVTISIESFKRVQIWSVDCVERKILIRRKSNNEEDDLVVNVVILLFDKLLTHQYNSLKLTSTFIFFGRKTKNFLA
jgi:hypothetical protein